MKRLSCFSVLFAVVSASASVYDAKLFSQVPVRDWIAGDRDRYLADVRAAGVDCVLPSFGDFYAFGEKRAAFFESLAQEIRFFEKAGVPTMVWTDTLGYGDVRTASADGKARFEGAQVLLGVEGGSNGAICPLDPKMLAYAFETMGDIAKAGARFILVDDDFVQSARGRLGCACPRHLARVSAKLGRTVTREEVRDSFAGAPNPVRSAFVDVTGEVAMEFAGKMRAAVNAVNPDIVMGLCLSYSHWDVEGVDMDALLGVLAGPGRRKIVRISGAPYWWDGKYHNAGLEGVIEFVRMQAEWSRGTGWKVFDENDPYPRKVAEIPAWRCELYDKAMIADGLMARHKYMLCYGPKRTEPGYLDAHLANMGEDVKLREIFANTEPAGVYVPYPKRQIREATLPTPRRCEAELVGLSSFPMESAALVHCGIPVRHDPAPESYALDPAQLGLDLWSVDFANFPRTRVRDSVLKAAERAGRPVPVYVETKSPRVYLLLRYDAVRRRYVALLENFGKDPVDVRLVTHDRAGTVEVRALAPHSWRVVTLPRVAAEVEVPGREPKISVFADAIRKLAKGQGVSLSEAADRLYALGVRGFDANVFDPKLGELAATKIRPINLYYFPGFSKQDGGAAENARALDTAVRYGVRQIMVLPPSFSDEAGREAEFAHVVRNFGTLVADAKKRGVVITTEDFGMTNNACSRSVYLKRLLDEIPDLRFALDSGNLYYAGRGEDILEMLDYARSRIVHVHLKDFSPEGGRRYVSLGLGAVPNEKIVKTTWSTGYAGWYTLENPVGDVAADTARQIGVLKAWIAAADGMRLEDRSLVAAFDAQGAVTVSDRRCGREWKTQSDVRTATVSEVRRDGEKIRCRVSSGGFSAEGTWSFDDGELVFALAAPTGAAMKAALGYPAPFVAAKGERILLPHGCGHAFDAGETDLGGFKSMEEMQFYTRDLKMGCWGHYAEHVCADGAFAQDAGYLAIVETPHDAKLDFRVRGNGCRAASVAWQPEKRVWGYDRSIRYAFFDRASPVAMAARYRVEAKRRGYLVTWREKARRHPEMAARYELLKGAPDVWYWEVDGEKGRMAAELRAMGFANFLFSTVTRRDLDVWVTPAEVREIVRTPGVIATEYDIYRDTMEPAMLDRIDAVRPHWPLEAWDRGDCVMREDGQMARGWKVALKTAPDVPKVGCALLCEAQAVPYVRERVAKRLAEAPYGARFLDVTGTSLGTCWHPRHPLTRRASEGARRATFRMLADEFSLLCGAEDGLECFVPCCDYFEGNFSAAHYRVDGGRHMWKTYEKSPEIMRRAIDPATRVPFFEMVFHDCIASYWYWTDYNNRFEDTWWQRDLLNAVSGTPPMYFFTREVFERQKARLAASVKIAARTAKATADAAIVDWRWLTPDRLVQRSVFSNGFTVTANFSGRPYDLGGGRILAPQTCDFSDK